MREIKFRAWDGKGMIFCDQSQSWEHGWNLRWLFDHCDGNIMQYTGLQDENGVDIYEGDICEFDSHDLVDRFVIRCEEWIEFYPDYIGEPLLEDRTRDFYRIDGSKIIGNIYESPELLK